MLTPPETTTQNELATRINDFSMDGPVAERRHGRGKTDLISPPALKTESFFAQNRAILLSGLSRAPRKSPSVSPRARTRGESPRTPLRRGLTPLVTAPTAAAGERHLSASCGSPVESPRAISPCVYVKATNQQRRSSSAVSSSIKAEIDDADGGLMKRDESTSSDNVQDTKTTPPPSESRLYVSALVRPLGPGRESFAIEREFDLHELLNAVPKIDLRRPSSVSILPSPVVRTPLTALSSLNTTPASISHTVAGVKRPAADDLLSPLGSPRSTLRRHGRQEQSPQPSQKDLCSPDKFISNEGIPIPIRPHPALGGLPGLAAIILSGYVKPGDVIELPLPHPETWPETVSYVYSRHGDVTEAIKENIAHLGGDLSRI